MSKSLLWPVEPVLLPAEPQEKRALCKLAGALVLAVFSPTTGTGRCPSCHGTEFHEHAGWIECAECGNFAILKTDLERMQT